MASRKHGIFSLMSMCRGKVTLSIHNIACH